MRAHAKAPRVDAEDHRAFEAFAVLARPRLVRAFVPLRGPQGALDAAAEALAWAWEHWDQVVAMENPTGYLYRVGRSRTRFRRHGHLPSPRSVGLEGIEPGLTDALRSLSRQQQTAVWLVHACEWSYAETAQAMGTSVPTVGTHVARAMAKLRTALHVEEDTP